MKSYIKRDANVVLSYFAMYLHQMRLGTLTLDPQSLPTLTKYCKCLTGFISDSSLWISNARLSFHCVYFVPLAHGLRKPTIK